MPALAILPSGPGQAQPDGHPPDRIPFHSCLFQPAPALPFLATQLQVAASPRIAKELSRGAFFYSADIKLNGQVAWQLDAWQSDAMPSKQRRKLRDLHLPGAPLLGQRGEQKRGLGWTGQSLATAVLHAFSLAH